MAPKQTAKGKAQAKSAAKTEYGSSPPSPFKVAPESLKPFYKTLSKKHIYVAHIDAKPKGFKRNIFLVPVLMNIAIIALFTWRINYIGVYYLKLIETALGQTNDLTLVAGDMTWSALIGTVLRRVLTFSIDVGLVIFVWPWPVEFFLGRNGNPVQWRWAVGFRDKEIYVRRSREWDRSIGDVVKDGESRNAVISMVRTAASPTLLLEKTGYLTMNGDWDLAWGAQMTAHALVDDKKLALDAFRLLVLVHHEHFGWLSVDMSTGENAKEEDRRRQVFAFRDALHSVGKEDLFFRWIEIVQFESSRPGGFTTERQVEVAQQIRELFEKEGINFDEFWKESVGSESAMGI